MNYLNKILLFAPLALVLVSCLDDEYEKRQNQELELLREYFEENNINEQASLNEVYVFPIVEGDGLSPVAGDFVRFNFIQTLIDGTIVYTNDSASVYWNTSDSTFYKDFIFAPIKSRCGYFNVTGLNIGMIEMKEGGTAKIVIPSPYAYNDFTTLIYEIELIEVIEDDIRNYEKNNLTSFLLTKAAEYAGTLDSTESGIYYLEEFSDDQYTETIEDLDTITLKYTGYYMGQNAELIQFKTTGSDSVEWIYNSDKYIEGFAEGLSYMSNKTKARIIMPYYRGYGVSGLTHSYYYTIVPTYSNLVYDVEILDLGKSD